MFARRWFIGFSLGFVFASTLIAADDGFVDLFDGSTLDGWRGYRQQSVPESWTVSDGTIQGNGSGPDLITEKMYSDFELEFEWKIAPNGNSGVIYRATEDEKESYQTGLEYQILDSQSSTAGGQDPIFDSGAIYALYGTKVDDFIKPTSEFNESKIVVQGNRIEHWLNGTKVTECVIGSPDWNKKIAASKFAKWPRFAKSSRGHIVLQSHGSSVWFRKLRIKELKSEPVGDLNANR